MPRAMANPIHDPTVHVRPSCTAWTREAIEARKAGRRVRTTDRADLVLFVVMLVVGALVAALR